MMKESQLEMAVSLFAKAVSLEPDQVKRKALYVQFEDAFSGIVKDWKLKVEEKLDNDVIRNEFRQLSDRKSRGMSRDVTISALSENDMKQVSYKGYKELGLIPWIVNEDNPCTAFVDSGFSFVAKKDDEVLGFILAYVCPTFGGYNYVYIDTFVVNSFAQG